ncbi:MAG: translation initiation factor IF-2 [Proteobacteria bacterium]|nr:translation initiation factor IF-2 [Pseudomonadota bacterium]
MAVETVEQLADKLSVPTERLLQQMQEAGLPQKDASGLVNEEDQQTLLAFLKRSHGESETAPKKITLKRRTISTLKTPSGSGRGRTVNVEVRKKRTYVRRGSPESDQPAPAPGRAVEAEAPKVVDSHAADVEATRRAAYAEAEAEAEKRREEAAREAVQIAEQRAKELAEKLKKEAEAKAAAPAKTAKELEAEAEETAISSRKDKRDRHDLDDEDALQKKVKHGNRKRRVEELLEDEVEHIILEEVTEIVAPDKASDIKTAAKAKGSASTLALSSRSRAKRAPARAMNSQHKFKTPTQEVTREVELGETITVSQLSQRMSVKAADVIKFLFKEMGVMVTINQSIDQETAVLVVEEFGHKAIAVDADALEKTVTDELVYEAEALPRAPVVTVMGHVDHGKTSLLDYIRKASVAEGEAGGITQHIGAYRVHTDHGEICFIDTPGHAAFTAMRARGANCTDIVILVVAADDGVMPQTVEAIQHSKGAGVPMVVAVNKMDLEGADPDRVKNELAAKDVIPEDWGGDTQFVPVSALTGAGVDDLLEAILLQAELLELKAVKDGPAQGVVIESELDKGRGPVATLLVQEGTLSRGDIIVAGEQFGRVRALGDENGKMIKKAGPATPVEVLGLSGTPGAGDTFMVTKDEKRAREVARFRRDKANEERLAGPAVSLDNFMESFGSQETQFLNVVVKADVRGSLEAIVSSLEELGNDEVKVNVVLAGVGGITESDATYAVTSEAVLFGFNVRADNAAKRVIENDGLDLRYYKVIYDLVDDVKAALSGMLSPEVREEIVGIALVKEVFESKKFGNVAGCVVTEGTVSRRKKIRVLRDNVVIYEGDLESLRHFKDEVEDVRSGTECGIGVKNYNDVRVGDQIEVFDSREVARQL